MDYSYTPSEGVRITIYFVNESGNYTPPQLLPMQKCFITIGGGQFAMYPKNYSIIMGPKNRVMKVDFIDETFKLDNYYVVLKNRGCGQNIVPLGQEVDTRTIQEKIAAALDPTAEVYKNFTQFIDIEYSFADFLSALASKGFNTSVRSSYDASIKRNFTGTFKDVLKAWCEYYGFGFFFENSQIIIVSPSSLQISLPSQIPDAISYEVSEDVDGTFGKTVCNYIASEGGEIDVNQIINTAASPSTPAVSTATTTTATKNNTSPAASSGALQIEELTLYPPQNENIGTPPIVQISIDINQAMAALFGRNFWILYNLKYDTLGEIGWTKGSTLGVVDNTINGLQSILVNETLQDKKFQMYSEWAKRVGGNLYISNAMYDLSQEKAMTWFSDANGQIFDFTSSFADSKTVQLKWHESPDGDSLSVIEGTEINDLFPGVYTNNKRIYYFDETDRGLADALALDDNTKNIIDARHKALIAEGSGSFSFPSDVVLTDATKAPLTSVAYRYIASGPNNFETEILTLIDKIKDLAKQYLSPKYSEYNISGISSANIAAQKNAKKISNNLNPNSNSIYGVTSVDTLLNAAANASVAVSQGNSLNSPANALGGGVNSNSSSSTPNAQKQTVPDAIINTNTLQPKKDGSLLAHYDKYCNCVSASSQDGYFSYKFDIRNISTDNKMPFFYQKTGVDTYQLTRDMGFVNTILANPYLPQLAVGRNFTTKTVSFTTNYFYQLPSNFLSNGLVSAQIRVGDNGVTCSYTFSNGVIKVPDAEKYYQQFEQMIRSSWTRQFNPKQVVMI